MPKIPQNRVSLPMEIYHKILDSYLLNLIDLHERIENSDFPTPVFERQSNQTSEEAENLSQSDDESYLYYEEDEESLYGDFAYEDRSEDSYDESKLPKLHLFALFLTSKSTYYYILHNLLFFEVRAVRALLQIHLKPNHRILFDLPDSVFPHDKHAGSIELVNQDATLHLVNQTRFTTIPRGFRISYDIDLAGELGTMTAQHLVKIVAKFVSRRKYYILEAHEWGGPRWIERSLEKAPNWKQKRSGNDTEWVFRWYLQEREQ